MTATHDFIRKGIDACDLPSSHPYWTWYIGNKKRRAYFKKKNDPNINWAWRLYFAGFRSGSRREWSPDNNWFGVSKYHPDIELIKGDRKVVISLGGFAMRYPNSMSAEMSTMIDNGHARYIRFEKNGRTFYETWEGIVPREHFVKIFCANY